MSNTSLLGSYGGQGNSSLMFRNRVINGCMRIDQRNAGASVTPTTAGTYTLDRWVVGITQSSKFSVQQSAVAPTGFANSLLLTSLSAYSVGAADTFFVQQYIEGFNTADFMFGTASAQAVSLSFWVRSSLTGTFGGSIGNASANYAYPFTYSISAANTWEQKTISIPGAVAGTWVGSTNGRGMRVLFSLGSGANFSGTANTWQVAGASNELYAPTGATSVVGTNGATLYITGVQLEAETATPFERRPIGTELALCQRYYERLGGPGGDLYKFICASVDASTTSSSFVFPYRVEKRTANVNFTYSGSFTFLVGAGTFSGFFIQGDGRSASQFAGAVSGTGFNPGGARFTRTNNDANAFLAFDAEL